MTTILKLTSLTTGDSITGQILRAESKSITTKTGQSFEGVYITLATDEGEVELQTAGNVKKFFKQDSERGMYDVGRVVTITRGEDVKLKNGFSTSNFFVEAANQPQTTPVKTANPAPAVKAATPLSKKAELEAKLAAQRGR